MNPTRDPESPARPRLFDEFPASSYEEWKAETERLLKGVPFDKRMRTPTPEGITLEPLYRRQDIEGLPHLGDLPGTAGARGARLLGYRKEPWLVAQEVFGASPARVAEQALDGLMRGETGLVLTGDRATCRVADPHEAAAGEVGVCGTPLWSLDQLDAALKGVELAVAPVFFRCGASAPLFAPLLVELAKRRGIEPAALGGSLGYDPVGDGVSFGTVPSEEELARSIGDLAAYAAEALPGVRLVRADGSPYRNAGGNAVQEIAAVLATANRYLAAMIAAGVEPGVAAGKIEFSFALGPDFFMEIAKLRAFRVVWAQVLRQWGVAEAPCFVSARTSLYNKTRRDPYTNMLRVTTEALSGVVGGVDLLTVGTFDEVIRPPVPFSRRIARNVQLILAEECELTKVIDPGGGSWYLEKLTDELGRAALAQFQSIEAGGGILGVLGSGSLQEQVAACDKANRKLLGQRRRSLVGTNVYPNLNEKPLDPEPVDRAAADAAASAARAAPQPGKAPASLAEAAEAFAAGATLGVVGRALGLSVGSSGVVPLAPHRLASDYEALRDAAEAYAAANGHPPRIALVPIGPLRKHKIRADFSRAFFEAGGFEVLQPEGAGDASEAAKHFTASGAVIAVVCGTDDQYAEHFTAFAAALKANAPGCTVLLAGFPGDNEEAWRAAGMDDYIFIKSDHYATNRKYLGIAGVTLES